MSGIDLAACDLGLLHCSVKSSARSSRTWLLVPRSYGNVCSARELLLDRPESEQLSN